MGTGLLNCAINPLRRGTGAMLSPHDYQQIERDQSAAKAKDRDICIGKKHIGDDKGSGHKDAEDLDRRVSDQQERYYDDSDVDRVGEDPRDEAIKQIDVLIAHGPGQECRRQPTIMHKIWEEL